VRFNPTRVANYRLIGFQQHRLREEDFRKDQVDAAELAAGEAATALYQVEVLPEGSGEVGEVYVRFRDTATGTMVERSWTIRYDPQAPRFDRASPSLQLAGMAALLSEKLGERSLASQFKLGDFAGVVNALRGHYAHEPRVRELVMMYARLRRMSGE
jgi:Ca-activated chloride channel family protein